MALASMTRRARKRPVRYADPLHRPSRCSPGVAVGACADPSSSPASKPHRPRGGHACAVPAAWRDGGDGGMAAARPEDKPAAGRPAVNVCVALLSSGALPRPAGKLAPHAGRAERGLDLSHKHFRTLGNPVRKKAKPARAGNTSGFMAITTCTCDGDTNCGRLWPSCHPV